MDEDYDVYGGAPWSAYHDDVDPFEAEYERRAEERAHYDSEPSAEEAEQIIAEMRHADARFFEQVAYNPYENSDETLHGLGDFDGGTDA